MGNIPKEALPQVIPSNSLFGRTIELNTIPSGIPIHGILGDQQAALFGHKCFNFGESKCTYGTGAFFLMQTKNKKIETKSGILTTVAWQINNEINYALEGSCFVAGAAVGFLRDNLEMIKSVKETDLFEKVEAAPNLYFIPSLCGLGAPWWRPEVKGALFGMTRSTTKKQIVQACIEGICFQIEDLISVFKKEASLDLIKLSVDGGACSNQLLMKTQANLSNIKISRPKILEITAYGVALLAAYGYGIFTNLDTLKETTHYGEEFVPANSDKEMELRQKKLTNWSKAIEALKHFHS